MLNEKYLKMETIIKSKFLLLIQEGNKSIKVFNSKFEREIGDILNHDGVKFKVCMLGSNEGECARFLGCYNKTAFNFFDYNTKDAKKK